jgi:tetratricopeptide (TPR) repeat protein
MAKELGKKLYVFVCGEGFSYDAPRDEDEPEDNEKRELQEAHRLKLLGKGKQKGKDLVSYKISGVEEIKTEVLKLELTVVRWFFILFCVVLVIAAFFLYRFVASADAEHINKAGVLEKEGHVGPALGQLKYVWVRPTQEEKNRLERILKELNEGAEAEKRGDFKQAAERYGEARSKSSAETIEKKREVAERIHNGFLDGQALAQKGDFEEAAKKFEEPKNKGHKDAIAALEKIQPKIAAANEAADAVRARRHAEAAKKYTVAKQPVVVGTEKWTFKSAADNLDILKVFLDAKAAAVKGEFATAIAHYEEVQRRTDRKQELHTQAGKEAGQLQPKENAYLAGNAAAEKGNYTVAVEQYTVASKKVGGLSHAGAAAKLEKVKPVEDKFQEGLLCSTQGNFAEAITAYTAADKIAKEKELLPHAQTATELEKMRSRHDAYLRGVGFASGGNFPEALKDYKEAAAPVSVVRDGIATQTSHAGAVVQIKRIEPKVKAFEEGLSFARNGNFGSAVEKYNDAVVPETYTVQKKVVSVVFKQAKIELDKISGSNNAYQEGRQHDNNGKISDAVTCYEAALAPSFAIPGKVELVKNIQPIEPLRNIQGIESDFRSAKKYEQRGEFREALVLYQRHFKKHSGIKEEKIAALAQRESDYQRGVEATKRGDAIAARAAYKSAARPVEGASGAIHREAKVELERCAKELLAAGRRILAAPTPNQEEATKLILEAKELGNEDAKRDAELLQKTNAGTQEGTEGKPVAASQWDANVGQPILAVAHNSASVAQHRCDYLPEPATAKNGCPTFVAPKRAFATT